MSGFKGAYISGLLLVVAGSCTPQENYDILITGGKIIDGSGNRSYYADIVIFDLQKVNDRSTFLDPHLYTEGICYVIINGKINIDDSNFPDNRAGRALRHGHDGGREGE